MTCSIERQLTTEKPPRLRLHCLAPLPHVWPCDCLLVLEVSQCVPFVGWSSEKQMCAFPGVFPSGILIDAECPSALQGRVEPQDLSSLFP